MAMAGGIPKDMSRVRNRSWLTCLLRRRDPEVRPLFADAHLFLNSAALVRRQLG